MRKISPVLAAVLVSLSSIVFAQPSGGPPAAQHLTLPLWPGAAPGTVNLALLAKEKDSVIVSTPTLTLYSPQGAGNGAAFVVFPGGGYQHLAIDKEGTEVCDWLTSKGIACVVVKYRVPGAGPYPKFSAALMDAQRAFGLVRQHAAEWRIDPHRIGVLGFSAGGHLAVSLSTHFAQRLYPAVDEADKLSCRPDFQTIVYPAYLTAADKTVSLSSEIVPTADTPPAFILQAEDDPVRVENAVAYFLGLKNANVPAELHLYAEGGHGYGLRRTALPVTAWPQAVEIWLHTIQVLPHE